MISLEATHCGARMASNEVCTKINTQNIRTAYDHHSGIWFIVLDIFAVKKAIKVETDNSILSSMLPLIPGH